MFSVIFFMKFFFSPIFWQNLSFYDFLMNFAFYLLPFEKICISFTTFDEIYIYFFGPLAKLHFCFRSVDEIHVFLQLLDKICIFCSYLTKFEFFRDYLKIFIFFPLAFDQIRIFLCDPLAKLKIFSKNDWQNWFFYDGHL